MVIKRNKEEVYNFGIFSEVFEEFVSENIHESTNIENVFSGFINSLHEDFEKYNYKKKFDSIEFDICTDRIIAYELESDKDFEKRKQEASNRDYIRRKKLYDELKKEFEND